MVAVAPSASSGEKLEKKPVKFSNLLLGAGLNMFEVTTLGQPLEVTKTTMAANRGDGFATALGRIWSRGGVLGCTYFLFFFPSPKLTKALNRKPAPLGPAQTIDHPLTPLFLQSTRASSPGLGSKPPPRALSSSSSLPRLNTMPAPLAPPSSVAASSAA